MEVRLVRNTEQTEGYVIYLIDFCFFSSGRSVPDIVMSKLNLTLYECLQQVSLEKYHGKFTERGILDVGGLLSLTMQDYPALGISSMADRQNLFYLIQTIKTMQVSSSQRGLLHNGTQNERLVPMEGPAVENKKGIILILEQTKCMRK